MGNWHKWTAKEHALLVANYMKRGDLDIAKMLNEKFPKGYPWTWKHVEKRRNYFHLTRGRKSGECFNNRNNMKASWDTRGRAKQGEIRVYKGVRFMKAGRFFKRAAREEFKMKHKEIAGDLVVLQTGEVLTRSQLANRNRSRGLGYTPELWEAKKILNELNRLINERR